MGLTRVEHSLYYLVVGTAAGTLDEEAAAKGLDEMKVAGADVATESEFLLLLYMRSDQRANNHSDVQEAHLRPLGFV